MATTTPNYGWPVPTSTDYVKDGATAIEALGDAIDSTVFGLPTGGQTLIATATLSAATAISFTSIPTTYKHLKIIFLDVRSTSGYWQMTLNNVTTGSYYRTTCSTTSVTGGNLLENSAGVGATSSKLAIIPQTFTASGNGTADGYVEVNNYSSTTVARNGNYAVTGYVAPDYYCNIGAYNYSNNGTAITRVDFVRSGSQTVTGTIQLWGIK